MADPEQLRRLRLDVEVWNRFVESKRKADRQWTADLRDADLRGLDLPGVDLRGADLTGTDLENVYLHRADLADAKLGDAILDHAILSLAKLDGAEFRSAKLRRADLAGVRMEDVDFRAADLSRAALDRAEIIACNLERTYLLNANLRDADLRGSRLVDADLSGAALTNADLRNVELDGAKFDDARLDGSKLEGADLRRTKIRLAYLGGSDLTGADLDGVDLRGARLAGAKLVDSKLVAADLRGAYLQQADLTGADLSRADLRGTVLEGAILHDAVLDGVVLTTEADSGKGHGSFLDLANCEGLESALGFDAATYLERAFKFAHRSNTLDARQWSGLVETTLSRIKALHKLQSATEASPAIIEAIDSLTTELMSIIKRRPNAVFDVDPRVFEEMVAEMLKSFGWQVELTPASNDGGYDIFGISPVGPSGIDATPHLIECKRHSRENKVGVKIVRELYGASIVSRPGCMLMFATTSHFTKGALEFGASRFDVKYRDYEGILEWINDYRPHPDGRLYLKDDRLVVPG